MIQKTGFLSATAAILGFMTLMPSPVCAQAQSESDSDIVVSGARSKLSNWRQAETSHVLILSDGSEAELTRLSRNLEWLHFLLSGLMGRGADGDDRVKIRITLIGDVAQFETMDLRNTRWQQGPFNDLFRVGRYYDPRRDGAFMASTRVDQRVVIEHTAVNAESVRGMLGSMASGTSDPDIRAGLQAGIGALNAFGSMQGPGDSGPTFGENAIQVSAEGLLYAGYAQHFLQTYFPAAYPRWYLDGFGQIFASFTVDRENKSVEFGRAPSGAGDVMREFGAFPIKDVLNDSYLTRKPQDTRWTPIHAWMLTHFLLFSDTKRPQLNQYLAARARGEDADTAAAIFGDQAQLGRELRAYFQVRKPVIKVAYDGSKIEQPIVRRLRESEAAFIKGRLELGARVVIPPAVPADAEPAKAKAMNKAREEALERRARWLNGLRRDATRWPKELQAQLLLAEAECQSGNAAECLSAAKRAEAIAPNDLQVLVWKANAMTLQAAKLAPSERKAMLAEARQLIAKANRIDPDAIGPLLAYYDSFGRTGEQPSPNAIDALQAALDGVPAAPETRLQFAQALVQTGKGAQARAVILPVAAGAYDSPERSAARTLLSQTASISPVSAEGKVQ
jgi:tetratricopeptide (TPR) repeat protein